MHPTPTAGGIPPPENPLPYGGEGMRMSHPIPPHQVYGAEGGRIPPYIPPIPHGIRTDGRDPPPVYPLPTSLGAGDGGRGLPPPHPPYQRYGAGEGINPPPASRPPPRGYRPEGDGRRGVQPPPGGDDPRAPHPYAGGGIPPGAPPPPPPAGGSGGAGCRYRPEEHPSDETSTGNLNMQYLLQGIDRLANTVAFQARGRAQHHEDRTVQPKIKNISYPRLRNHKGTQGSLNLRRKLL